MLVSLNNSRYLRVVTQTSGYSFSKMLNFWVQFFVEKVKYVYIYENVKRVSIFVL